MKTKSKISAYILRGAAAALLFLCVWAALAWAVNLPNQRETKHDGVARVAIPGPNAATIAQDSSTSSTIAFERDYCDNNGCYASDIFVMNPDGSNQRRLTDGSHPSFSADGSKIAFARGGNIWVIDLALNQTQLTTSGDADFPSISAGGS